MMHARIPDFSTRLPITSTVDHVPTFADPILAVIDAHAEAYAVFQVAPEGKPAERAELAMGDTMDALLAASCATRFGGLALPTPRRRPAPTTSHCSSVLTFRRSKPSPRAPSCCPYRYRA